ncbi:Mannan endo-1,4-beta-mannosidase [compost metagenome]
MNIPRKYRIIAAVLCLFLLASLRPWNSGDNLEETVTREMDSLQSAPTSEVTTGTITRTAQSPVNPNATQEARELLQYLYDQSGKGLISGQHDYLEAPDDQMNKLKKLTGQYAILHGYELGPISGQSADMIDKQRRGVVQSAINWYKGGGIVAMTFHEYLPGTSPDWSNVSKWISQDQFNAYVTPGTAEYNQLIADLDQVAVYLKMLQDAGVPVLWRPYHEMNGGWFWWGQKNNFSALWDIMYDRFVGKHKLNNLIWVWNPNAPNSNSGPYEDYYPGADKVDVLAADIYDNDYQQSYYDKLLKLADGKPIAIGESGELPDPQQLAKTQSQWVYVMTWGKMLTENNSTQKISSFMKSGYTLSREDFVKVKQGGTNSAGKSNSSNYISSRSSGGTNGLKGEYFTNRFLEGDPVYTRTDGPINFAWKTGSPVKELPDDYFSVLWTGRIKAPATGTYTFKLVADDGVRLWIDGKPIIKSWVLQNDIVRTATVKLKGNTYHAIRVEYFESKGKANIKLLWKVPGGQEEVIPKKALFLPE